MLSRWLILMIALMILHSEVNNALACPGRDVPPSGAATVPGTTTASPFTP